MSARPGMKMSELAEASGVSAGTIKHYLREVRTIPSSSPSSPSRR